MSQTVLVTGATGAQGSATISALLAAGYRVRALVPPGEDPARLTAQGIAVVTGSFTEAASVTEAFAGVQHVVLSFPLLFGPGVLLDYARHVVAAYRASRVETIVFNTNLPVQPAATGFVAFDSKRHIEQLFDAEALPYISLRPTIYLDNLAAPWSIPVIRTQHLLPYPVAAGQPLAWLSHRDLAQFVVAAVQQPQLVGEKFNLGGAQLLTGEDLAVAISRQVGYQVRFAPVTPDEFERQLAGAYGPDTAREIANIYRFVATHPAATQAPDLRERTLAQLPVLLESAAEWAQATRWS